MKTTAEYIYRKYRAAGMTAAGAAAMIGAGIEPESAFIVNNVEDRAHKILGWTDEQYTLAVDNGTYTRFVNDAYGYGLHQWTLGYRKNKMLNRAKQLGKSIGDIDFQLDFAIYELKGEPEYFNLWKALTTSNDVDKLSDMVVGVFERPANTEYQKNIRRPLSRKWFQTLNEVNVELEKEENSKSEYWPPRMIQYGMEGPDVKVAQAILEARGYPMKDETYGSFGFYTKNGIKDIQEKNGLDVDGIIGNQTWPVLLKR